MYEWFQGYCGWFGRGARAAGGGTNGRMDGGMIECTNVGIGEGREAGREGCADGRMNGRRRGRRRERTEGGADGGRRGFTNGRMRGRTNTRMNENTGLHPVLGYFAPSGLGGLMHNADNLATNARMPG